MNKQNNHEKKPGMKYLLSALVLVCVIVLCFSVGKTYAVITTATNVAVNTFYGESESQEPDTDDTDSGDTENPTEDETPTEENPSDDTQKPSENETYTDTTEYPQGDETTQNETYTDTTEYNGGDTDTTAESGESTESSESSKTSDTDGAQTGDSMHLLLWSLICAAALIVLLFSLWKLFRLRKE